MRNRTFHIKYEVIECIKLPNIHCHFEYKHNTIFKIYHNHRRGEARRKSRRLRSRIRRRLRASGGATGGAQFSAATGSSSIGGNSVMSQPGFYSDYRQVRKILPLQLSQPKMFVLYILMYVSFLVPTTPSFYTDGKLCAIWNQGVTNHAQK